MILEKHLALDHQEILLACMTSTRQIFLDEFPRSRLLQICLQKMACPAEGHKSILAVSRSEKLGRVHQEIRATRDTQENDSYWWDTICVVELDFHIFCKIRKHCKKATKKFVCTQHSQEFYKATKTWPREREEIIQPTQFGMSTANRQ